MIYQDINGWYRITTGGETWAERFESYNDAVRFFETHY